MGSEFYVKLDTIEKVQKFVNVANSIVPDLDVIYGRYIIDAKSVMGIFAMDLSKDLLIRIHSSDLDECERIKVKFEDFIVTKE